MEPGEADAQRIVEAARFDVIVFLYACQSEMTDQNAAVRGELLDALLALLNTAQRNEVTQFILITDRRAFGKVQEGLETEQPIPDTPGGVLNKAAEDCLEHCILDGFGTLLIRVDSLYAPHWDGCFLTSAVACGDGHETLRLTMSENAPCGFLRASDLADFLCIAIHSRLTGIVHLTDDETISYGNAVARLQAYYPKLRPSWSSRASGCVRLKLGRAAALGWAPKHRWWQELDLLCADATKQKPSLWDRVHALHHRRWRLLPLIEIVLLAVFAFLLSLPSGSGYLVRYYTLWLLYVALISGVNGLWHGVAASVVASAVYLLALGRSAAPIALSGGSWLPIIAYAVCGVTLGLLHNTRSKQYLRAQRVIELREEENALLETVYQHATQERNRLMEKAQAWDSYGRIYGVARELDSLQPEQVLLTALDVVETVLQSQSVAIYYFNTNSEYARLVLRSSGLEIANSLALRSFPALDGAIRAGTMYQSDDSEPSLAAPILMDGAPVAMIVLWRQPDGGNSLYYKNLFSITCGLVESATVRAMKHLEFAPDVYVEGTHLLSEKYFLSVLKVFENMRSRGAGDYLLLCISSQSDLSTREYDRRISLVARSTDLCGRMDCGAYYALLPQADSEHFIRIAARFAEQALFCDLIETL